MLSTKRLGSPKGFEERVSGDAEFWSEVAKQIPDWQAARDRKISAADLRREFVHAHALALAGLARAGNALLRKDGRSWKPLLKKLGSLDWSRANSELWEGRATRHLGNCSAGVPAA